jgi:hypothetical protein
MVQQEVYRQPKLRHTEAARLQAKTNKRCVPACANTSCLVEPEPAKDQQSKDWVRKHRYRSTLLEEYDSRRDRLESAIVRLPMKRSDRPLSLSQQAFVKST